jgi:hypothetical protein
MVPGAHHAMFAGDTYISASEKHECYVLCKLHRGLTAVNSWCECWNIKINEGKTQVRYFSRRLRVPDDILQLNGRDIPFANNVTYLSVTFEGRVTLGRHIERTVAKALCTYIRTDSLFKNGHLNTNIKFMLYEALIRSVMTYASPTWEYAADTYLLRLQHLQTRMLRKLHMAFKITYVYDYRTKLCRAQAEVILNHVNPNVHGIGQVEAMHWKYKRRKLGGGQTYDFSAD